MRLLSPIYFFVTLVIFWICWAVFLLLWGYQGSFLEVNSWHFPLGDTIMPHLTNLGDGVLLTSICALVLIKRDNSLFLTLVAGMILLTLLVAFFKQIVFTGWDRPPYIFPEEGAFHAVFLKRRIHNAFPSGHSAASTGALSFLATYSLFRTKWLISVGIASLAALLCYTRVYIGIHFVGDILAGSILGFLVAMFSLQAIYPFMAGYVKQLDAARKKWFHVVAYTLVSLLMVGSIVNLINTFYT